MNKCGIKDEYFDSKRLAKYRISCIKNDEEFEKVYQDIKKDLDLNVDYKEFSKLYDEVFANVGSYDNVAEYEHSLKDRCYIGILSNLTIFDKKRIDKQVNLSLYDYVFLSFEYGLKKSNIEFFNRIQNKLPFKPQDILFIDDRKENTEMALKLGWNVFQTTGLELNKIKQRCEDFLGRGDHY
jgi:HAD superfamily hydrolase (TIGR01509 family)